MTPLNISERDSLKCFTVHLLLGENQPILVLLSLVKGAGHRIKRLHEKQCFCERCETSTEIIWKITVFQRPGLRLLLFLISCNLHWTVQLIIAFRIYTCHWKNNGYNQELCSKKCQNLTFVSVSLITFPKPAQSHQTNQTGPALFLN